MNALDAVTAHEVVRDLGTLVARDRLSHGTRFPTGSPAMPRPTWFARAGRAIKLYLARRRTAAELAGLSPHMLRDLGLNPAELNTSIGQRLDQVMAEREMLQRRALLRA